jgi:hypothetical protein
MTIPPRAMPRRDICYTETANKTSEERPLGFFIVLASIVGVVIALALIWAAMTAPSRVPMRLAPAPHSPQNNQFRHQKPATQ